MEKAELRACIGRILKSRTGLLGRVLMDRAHRLRSDSRGQCPSRQLESPPAASPPLDCTSLARKVDRAGGPRVPSSDRFRVLYVVRPGPSVATCTRYRGYNIMEALRRLGVEVDHLDDRRIPERLEELLLFDLVVLVRRSISPELIRLLEFAEEFSIPVVCDLDDYLFDEAVIPHSDYLSGMDPEGARGLIREYRELVVRSNYYTGATEYLKQQAA